jgi:hypothetical protein
VTHRETRPRALDLARRNAWALTFGAVILLLAVQRIAALGTIPPGLHSDEASIGYNAWAIAHHGVDEHGASFPLFFEAFGEYKSPLYVYLLAPFTWFLPLTSATERLPAALCGVAMCVLIAATAYRVTRSRPVAMLTLLTTAVAPWAVIEARVGIEAPTMGLCLAAAAFCVSRAFGDGRAHRGWMWGAGIALGLGVFSYSSARLLVAALVIVLIGTDRRWRPGRESLPLLLPVVIAYGAVAVYAIVHPGALTHRLAGISIQSDEPGVLALAGRFVRNYLTYTGVPFLATRGDAVARYSTGFGGMLSVVSLPAIVAGLAVCVARRREALPPMILAGLVLGPVPAALTNDGTPQAVRFALLAAAYGWQAMLPWLYRHRTAAWLLAGAASIEVGGFFIDLDTRYPNRALAAFNTGELTAIGDAHQRAGSHRVLLSTSFDQPYIEALFALQPAPPPAAVHEDPTGLNRGYHDQMLATIGMAEGAPSEMTALAMPGDLMVMTADDRPPAGAVALERVTVTITEGEVFNVGPSPSTTVLLAVIWQR